MAKRPAKKVAKFRKPSARQTFARQDMQLERDARRRREINSEGDAMLAQRLPQMGLAEVGRATRARARAHQMQNEADAAVRDARSRPYVGEGANSGRVWVPGHYRTVRGSGNRFWVPGYYRQR